MTPAPARMATAEAVMLAGLTLVGVLLRFYNLGMKSLWYDEAVIYHVVQGSWRDILTQNALENSAPPLYALLLGVLTGPDASEGVLRALSAVAGVAAIPLAYLLAREFLTARVAWLVPLLVALSPVQLLYSQQLREYSLTTATAMVLLLAFTRFIREPVARPAAWLAVSAVLGLVTQYGMGLLLTALNLVCLGAFLYAKRPLASYRYWLLAQLPAAAVAVVLYLTVVRHQMPLVSEAGVGYLQPYYWDGAGQSLLAFLTSSQHNIVAFAFPGLLMLLLWAMGLLAFLFGAQSGLATALCLAPMALTIFAAMTGVYPYGEIRQDIFLTPMIYVCAALGADRLLAILPRRLPVVVSAGALVALALAVALPGLGAGLAIVNDSPGVQPMRRVTEALSEQLQANSNRKIYVYYNAIPAFRYYWRNHQEPWIAGGLHRSFMDDSKAQEQMLSIEKELGELTASGQPCWVVLSHMAAADQILFLEFLGRSASVTRVEGASGSSLFLVTPTPTTWAGPGDAGQPGHTLPAPGMLNLF